jgi:Lar family restriction alleviation protein
MTNPNPSPELLPCPKCGDVGELRQSRDGDAEWIRCKLCGHEGAVELSEAEAIAAWNTRTALAQTPPPPSLSTDVQSAATGFHEHDVSLKVATPALGEVERLRLTLIDGARIMSTSERVQWVERAKAVLR